MLSDGTEFGLIPGVIPKRNACAPVPSGQGLVVRYRRKEDSDPALYRWVEGETGFIRGFSQRLDGTEEHVNLSLSTTMFQPPVLAWYDDTWPPSYGLKGYQLPGNRIALYGLLKDGTAAGLRVYRENGGLAIRAMTTQKWPLSLDVAFVRMNASFAVDNEFF